MRHGRNVFRSVAIHGRQKVNQALIGQGVVACIRELLPEPTFPHRILRAVTQSDDHIAVGAALIGNREVGTTDAEQGG